MKQNLLVGIGNKGRGDDGLGWAFVDHFKNVHKLKVIYRYQLQVEDAELISHYRQVWFADASAEDYGHGFKIEPLEALTRFNYTTHALHPAAVLGLCRQLFDSEPKAFIIGITGEDFSLGQSLSVKGRFNLEQALSFFHDYYPQHQ